MIGSKDCGTVSRRKLLWNGFKKCGISNAIDGAEDDEIYQDDESDTSEDTNNVEIEDDTSDIDSLKSS